MNSESDRNDPWFLVIIPTLIARFLEPTWGPSGDDIIQVGPMLAPWTLLSRNKHSLLFKPLMCVAYRNKVWEDKSHWQFPKNIDVNDNNKIRIVPGKWVSYTTWSFRLKHPTSVVDEWCSHEYSNPLATVVPLLAAATVYPYKIHGIMRWNTC